jgi:Mono-functional DNA-alkylating methyl methanesulfonate N-term
MRLTPTWCSHLWARRGCWPSRQTMSWTRQNYLDLMQRRRYTTATSQHILFDQNILFDLSICTVLSLHMPNKPLLWRKHQGQKLTRRQDTLNAGPFALQSLYCGNTASDQIVQITRQSLRLIDAGTQQLAQEWRPPDGLAINVAAASPTQASMHTYIPQRNPVSQES